MQISLENIEQREDSYRLFFDHFKNEETKRKYSKILKRFLKLIPNKVYEDSDGLHYSNTLAFQNKEVQSFLLRTKNAMMLSEKIPIENDSLSREKAYRMVGRTIIGHTPLHKIRYYFINITNMNDLSVSIIRRI